MIARDVSACVDPEFVRDQTVEEYFMSLPHGQPEPETRACARTRAGARTRARTDARANARGRACASYP
jgi:hypothetical protein